MNPAMIRVIALHEFLAAVLRKSFVLMTLGMPLLFGAYLGLVTGLGALAAADEASRQSAAKPVGIVDPGGLVADPGAFRIFEDRARAEAAIRNGRLSAFAVIPSDYVQTGEYALYVPHLPTAVVGPRGQDHGPPQRAAPARGRRLA